MSVSGDDTDDTARAVAGVVDGVDSGEPVVSAKGRAAGSVCVSVEGMAAGDSLVVSVDGREVLLCNVAGRFHAVANLCTHAQIALGRGRLLDYEIECPRHGARFDVRDGKPRRGPARKALAVFSVTSDGRTAEISAAPVDEPVPVGRRAAAGAISRLLRRGR